MGAIGASPFQVTKFYLLVHDVVSPIVLTSRVRKTNADLSVTVDSPQYLSTSEGHHAFINKHYKPTNSWAAHRPHWTLDDTLYEVKSVVTLIQNRIPQVPMDVVIHFKA